MSVWDLTHAEWQARRQMHQIVAFLRKYVPGFERFYLAQSGVTIGVRETRRIVDECQLTADDVLGARKWDDAVARGTYPNRHPQSPGQGDASQAAASGGVLRHPAALSGAPAGGPAHGGGPLHLGHARGALVLPGHADSP